MTRRNVVVIMSDEHDPRIMGCSGHPFVLTPNFDHLASRGTRFVNAYTPSPICVPARAAFATGMRVHQIRHWDNAMPYFGAQRGWGHVLQDHGVRVESIGKLHYRAEEDPAGFDKEHLPMHVVGGYGMVWGSIRDPFKPRHNGPRMLGERIGPGESTYTEYDRDVTARAVEWLKDAAKDNTDQPFVLYIGLVAPHFPFVVAEKFFNMYPPETMPEPKLHPNTGYVRHPWVQEYADFMGGENRFVDNDERLRAFSAYFGLVSWLDDNVGQIVQTINGSSLADDTTIIYTSDHGDNLGARGVWGKSTLYEESVKVPMIVAGPDVPVSVNKTCVDLIDLFPTILEGASINPAAEMKGRPGQSLLDIASSPSQKDRVILSEYHAAGSNSAGFMVRKGRWKYHYYVGFRSELFDLEADPEELNDLGEAPEYEPIRQQMHDELLAICDPHEVDRVAKEDQAALIERFGGIDAAHELGSSTSTPVTSACSA
jgi:choline-sulfatase